MRTFIFSDKSADDIPIAVCGFCQDNSYTYILDQLKEINRQIFGNYSAVYIIDYRLSQLIISLLSSFRDEIVLAAATTAVPDATAPTGGVLGSLKAEDHNISAKPDIFEYRDYLIGTCPGQFAFAAESRLISDSIRERLHSLMSLAYRQDFSISIIKEFYQSLKEARCPFIMITDGSGPGAFGPAATELEIVPLNKAGFESFWDSVSKS